MGGISGWPYARISEAGVRSRSRRWDLRGGLALILGEMQGWSATAEAAPSDARKRAPPPPPHGEGGKRAVHFASTGEAGGGGALRSSVTEGEAARVQ